VPETDNCLGIAQATHQPTKSLQISIFASKMEKHCLDSSRRQHNHKAL
jgi:hypothetical protein